MSATELHEYKHRAFPLSWRGSYDTLLEENIAYVQIVLFGLDSSLVHLAARHPFDRLHIN